MKRILFVDDEPAVLDGLRMMLRKHHKIWHMDFAGSGAEAIQMMEKEPYDLLCSDMRMPVMDGAELLSIAATRWPGTIRIILSGYAERSQTIRLVPIAHQYLSKPCESALLESTLMRCLSVQELLNSPQLRSLVGSMRSLPTLPKTYQRLCDAMANPEVSAAEIAAIVGADSAIAAKVLQVVNSAFFRLARKISRIDHAVSYLGFFVIRNLVLSTEVFSQMTAVQSVSGMSVESIQRESLRLTGVIKALTHGSNISDDAIMVGLLHDIGYLIFMQVCPDKLAQAFDFAKSCDVSHHIAEQEIIGASHATVGAYLLALWGLPYSIVDAVAHHHDHQNIVHSEFDLLCSVVLAEKLVDEYDKGLVESQQTSGTFDFERLHVPYSIDEARRRVECVLSSGEP